MLKCQFQSQNSNENLVVIYRPVSICGSFQAEKFVFSTSLHLLCEYHINIFRKCGG